MAAYAQELPSEMEELPMDIESMMNQKAIELFNVCDAENKGFITKRDMQRLQAELPLNPEQLEAVFDSLDDDGNGFLTLEEFTTGFGSFIGVRPPMEPQSSNDSTANSEHIYESEHQEQFGDDDEMFSETMTQMGATGIVDDQHALKQLWSRLRREEPELLGQFEDFIVKVTSEVKRTQNDYENLESVLRNKTYTHDEEVRKLYDEMEQQIRAEKEKVVQEERTKERQMKEELERELMEKDRNLQELMRSQQEMERRLQELNQTDAETRMENERLLREKLLLEDKLEHSQAFVEDTRSHIDSLKKQQKDEKRQRAMQAFQITEGIALERESLVKQLDMLREVNKKLKDEKEESWAKHLVQQNSFAQGASGCLQSELSEALGERAPDMKGSDDGKNGTELITADSSTSSTESKPGQTQEEGGASKRSKLTKQGSLLSNYFGSGPQGGLSVDGGLDEDIECDDDMVDYTISKDYTPSLASQQLQSFEPYRHQQSDPLQRRGDSTNSDVSASPRGERHEPVGANSEVEVAEHRLPLQQHPERVFKVVFVGDSGVGKSTLIHQFCKNEFVDTFSATIGVDFQVKSIGVDGHVIALQLWDTAGQERFRSITKQYFRKADGVIVMYDVTSEPSFTNVRNWMDSVQEGTDDNTVIMLLGNKLDLLGEEEEGRSVKEKEGMRLSEDYSALFFETSAKSSANVQDAMLGLARLLQEKEDREMEYAVTLQHVPPAKKKGCCG